MLCRARALPRPLLEDREGGGGGVAGYAELRVPLRPNPKSMGLRRELSGWPSSAEVAAATLAASVAGGTVAGSMAPGATGRARAAARDNAGPPI